ncbi:hypothetical protein WSM22_30500 [Cytophagales bacterium WSM2-2]|nr:hypothetical protein WSM22_30500 [Cytophagales bacterium WSM2-2]
MRTLFTTILLTISVIVFGQKKSPLGKYTHSYTWYQYFLTLGDSGKFIVEEHSDSGLKTTTGTWTINGRLIKLVPTKCISDWGSEEIYEVPLSYLKESFISMDNENKLTILAPKNQPDSMTYKIPDYKLIKIPK